MSSIRALRRVRFTYRACSTGPPNLHAVAWVTLSLLAATRWTWTATWSPCVSLLNEKWCSFFIGTSTLNTQNGINKELVPAIASTMIGGSKSHSKCLSTHWQSTLNYLTDPLAKRASTIAQSSALFKLQANLLAIELGETLFLLHCETFWTTKDCIRSDYFLRLLDFFEAPIQISRT